jgi:hypothetical protein
MAFLGEFTLFIIHTLVQKKPRSLYKTSLWFPSYESCRNTDITPFECINCALNENTLSHLLMWRSCNFPLYFFLEFDTGRFWQVQIVKRYMGKNLTHFMPSFQLDFFHMTNLAFSRTWAFIVDSIFGDHCLSILKKYKILVTPKQFHFQFVNNLILIVDSYFSVTMH